MTLVGALTGVKLLFAHDTEEALVAATALVNTDDIDGDKLPDISALDAFIARYGWTGRREHTDAELRAVRELRSRLRRIWETDEAGVVEVVNGLLRESRALPQLVRHGDEPYHVHATSPDAPLAERLAVEAAMAFADVVRGGQLARLRICEYPGCGNRAAVTAYRARKSQAR